MRVADCYHVVKHKDNIIPNIIPRNILGKGSVLDIRIWYPDVALEKPLLLVNASKRYGCAVKRNFIRRQVRMALLLILREKKIIAKPYIIWVRPSKFNMIVGVFKFQEIENQIRLALSRWEAR